MPQVAQQNIDWLKEKALDSLVKVEGGTFRMGDVGYVDKNGERQYFTAITTDAANRNVTLSSYYIQKYEVTLKEFDAFTDATNQALVSANLRGKLEHKKPEYPATGMTWFQAQDYCKWVGRICRGRAFSSGRRFTENCRRSWYFRFWWLSFHTSRCFSIDRFHYRSNRPGVGMVR